MLHYYFLKYWSRGLVGLMVAIVVGYFGIFSYSLMASQNDDQADALESAQVSATPSLKFVNAEGPYQQSLKVFEGIQKLKDNNQDTSKLESKYADSVKNLSNQNEKEAVSQLNELASEIAKINETLSPAPQPSDVVLSGTPSPSISPAPSGEEDVKIATQSAVED